MSQKNPAVEPYFIEGCGRCELGGTPQCKVHSWTKELKELRSILLKSGLTEELKWSIPCYTHGQKNVLTLGALKDHCSIGFFKGALLDDPAGLLQQPGKNSQAARVLRFTNLKEVRSQQKALLAFIAQAIDLEKKGAKVQFKKAPEPLPEELKDAFKKNRELKKAFTALTPGRQRGYIIHISGAQQSKTRLARIEKCIPKILAGKGFHDR